MSHIHVTPKEWAEIKMHADDLKAVCKERGWQPAVVMVALARHLRTSEIAAETLAILGEMVVNGEDAFEEHYKLAAEKH